LEDEVSIELALKKIVEKAKARKIGEVEKVIKAYALEI